MKKSSTPMPSPSIAELKFDAKKVPEISEAAPPSEIVLVTDVIMLQKADLWMGQFKTRLNIGIVSMVMLWVGVSYYKSTQMQALPIEPDTPQIVADGSDPAHADLMIHSVESDSLTRQDPSTLIKAEDKVLESSAEAVQDEKVVEPLERPTALVKKTKFPNKKVVQKPAKSRDLPVKSQTKNQKKLKKSLAAKPS